MYNAYKSNLYTLLRINVYGEHLNLKLKEHKIVTL